MNNPFKTWLERKRISDKQAALDLGVERSHMCRLLSDNPQARRWPSRSLMEQIYIYTGFEVDPNAWFDLQALREQAREKAA